MDGAILSDITGARLEMALKLVFGLIYGRERILSKRDILTCFY